MGIPGTDIEFSFQDGVAVVRFSRPSKRNAVSLAMWHRLTEVFTDLARDERARAVILTGSGGHFCAGADISEFAEVRADIEAGHIYEQATEEATIAIRDWPGPTIAAISGYALGGGCGLALACDVRIGDPNAKMGIPAARLGIIYSALDCGLLYRQVGLANAKRVLYAGRPFTFRECVEMRLLDMTHETDALVGALALAADLAANAPLSLKGSKVVLEACADGSAASRTTVDPLRLRGAFAARSAASASAPTSADYAEGRTAFMEKRQPVFQGR